MNVIAERSRPLWADTAEPKPFPPLDGDAQADVVVVGAGIAGLSVAYELALEGKLVLVLDRGIPGGGMTARTTAHLASDCDDGYHEMIRMHGLPLAQAFFASHAAAISRIEHIAKTEGIDCDFARVDGHLFLAPETDPKILEQEFEAGQQVGIAVTWSDRAPLAFDTGRCLTYPGQARFHPLKYLNGLMRAVRARNGRIHGDTAVMEVKEEGGFVVLKTEAGHTVRARAAAFCTNSPTNDWVAIHSKQAPYRTYAMAFRVPEGAVADALFWDTSDPYNYVRLQPGEGGAWLITGGADHKSGEANDMEERFARLEAWTRDRFPAIGEVTHRWSGQVYEPVDYAGYIGRNPGNTNVYVATGDSGQGMTHGAVAGMLIRDLVLGRDNPWTALYEPGRVRMKAAGEYIRENLTVAQNFTQYVRPGEVASVDELKPGEGAVLGTGKNKIAACRDENGALHVRSATCSHLGCVVQWNSFEQCWDCPCHGSQFSMDGEVLQGPALAPLSQVDPAAVPRAKETAKS